MRNRSHIAVLAFTLLFTLGLLAQESAVKGNLGGTVMDPSGAVVSNAKVTLTGPIGTRTTTTDSEGRFGFDLLTPGYYGVKAEMTGFKAVETKGVEVFTNKTSNIRLELVPGGASETVEVTAAAVTVDPANTGVSTALNDTFYSKLPIARNVTGLFYASAGVASGGGTGAANPSIAGGSGLENQYVADGVSITDGAFGGIGVYSRVYGPLATGINLSFVKEVDVKTAGYEPQYGNSTGGIVQIVTKSGGNEYHGSLSGFVAPKGFELKRLESDDFNRLNQQGKALHQGAFDVSGELGGYVPGLKDKLFFFGAFNPSWTRYYDRVANMHGVLPYPMLGDATLEQLTYDYSGKLTWKLSDKHTIESSVFGDPTHSNSSAFNTLSTFSKTTFSKLNNGTRNWVARWNATLSPTWLFNASLSWGHNYLTETPNSPGTYQIADLTGRGNGTSFIGPDGTPLTGTFTRQGLGYYEDTQGDNYALNFDTQKVAHLAGEHTFSIGYRYERNSYAGERHYSGPKFTITPTMASDPNVGFGYPAAAGLRSDAAFQLRRGSFGAHTNAIPGYGASVGGADVYLLQVRGEFGNTSFDTHGRYHAAYVNDSWAVNRRITFNVGYRWEQQFMQGTKFVSPADGLTHQPHYTYTDNWSPRIGVSIDPMGDRKSKIFANFARYSYAIPLDMAIRSLSNELDFPVSFWLPQTDASNNLLINPDGTLPNPILDDAHFLGAASGASLSSTTAIAPGTKMQYLQEWAGGVEHEFGHGIVLDVRFTNRRMRRIVEDMAGISPEAYQAGLSQNYLISNPNKGTDLFTNPVQIDYPSGSAPPAGCGSPFIGIDPVVDTFGNTVPPGAMCIGNPSVAGLPIPDGIPDGFVNPVRNYKSVEVELNKSFSKGWQLRTNYRWSTLVGNYEGAFRNDNGQSDPSISSLFDFIAGDFGLLGNQFGVGFLNTDRRHIFNNFVSYTFSSSFLKNLTLGTGVRVESGIPINDLKAHPAYQNAGEIPVGGRGSLGRTNADGQADVHADYFFKVSERQRIHFGADMFNITNQRTQLRVDQNEDRSFGVPNLDFKKPTGSGTIGVGPAFQRPFNARLFVRWEF